MDYVTGATGLVGAHLLLQLTANGQRVRALKRSKSSLNSVQKLFEYHERTSDLTQIDWLEGDVSDVAFLSESIQPEDTVFHCAALVSFMPGMRDELIKTNVDGTANIVNACLQKKARRLIYVSSTAAIGSQASDIIHENMLWNEDAQNSDYSLSKFYAEQEVWRGVEEGLPVVIVNPSIIVGPSEWKKSSTAMFETAVRGMRFYTSGANGFVDVRDVVNVMLGLTENEIYNRRFLLSGENAPFRDYFSLVAQITGKNPPHIFAPRWASLTVATLLDLARSAGIKIGGINRRSVISAYNVQKFDNAAVRQILNYPFKSLKEALEYTAAVYRFEKNSPLRN